LEELIDSWELGEIDKYIHRLAEVRKMEIFFQEVKKFNSQDAIERCLKEVGFRSLKELENENDLYSLVNAYQKMDA
jgi:hypothetical protein